MSGPFFWLHLGGEIWYLEYSAFVAQATVCAVTPIETSRRIELTTKHYAPLIARTRSFFFFLWALGMPVIASFSSDFA